MATLTKSDIDRLRAHKAAAEDALLVFVGGRYRWTTSPHGEAFWDAADRYSDARQALLEATSGPQ